MSARGFDLISLRILKIAVYCKPSIILNLINKCLKIGYFPKLLKISIIISILKKNNLKRIDYLRTISLLPTLGKLIEG